MRDQEEKAPLIRGRLLEWCSYMNISWGRVLGLGNRRFGQTSVGNVFGFGKQCDFCKMIGMCKEEEEIFP